MEKPMPYSPKWFALMVQHRHEKKVHQRLKELGIISYLPTQRVTRQWSDRIKQVEEPLFSCYVFVHLPENQLYKALALKSVFGVVSFEGKPASIRDKEIEQMKIALSKATNLEIFELCPLGTLVEILDGPFKGIQGMVIKVRNEHKLVVFLKLLGKSLIVDTEATRVKVLATSTT
ncbi:UpxY family transcription antiterminator [Xanthovirga aplysinae]|uniref:UpxY family transcription antiterminator n=1 Tax=Xanthovirga aplysinae TaxID=2529853 RepID=UPI0012BBEFC4|nr:UpxY family transcription antiterminator [Xanthovirga aplysinae]MTI29868.1 UpxY family transcription antiterminator [Xanthovirga aplysinae]